MVFFYENEMKLEQKFQKLWLKFQKYFFENELFFAKTVFWLHNAEHVPE